MRIAALPMTIRQPDTAYFFSGSLPRAADGAGAPFLPLRCVTTRSTAH
jgi:hypothetical protein